MAKIILSGNMVRTPYGGLNLWHLAWLNGIRCSGHEIYFVEKSMWPNACYDVSRKVMTDDCNYGISKIKLLFESYGLGNNWCFVDYNNKYYGMSRKRVESIFGTADLFIDLEWGEWEEESLKVPLRAFFDGEPGWFQLKLIQMIEKGISIPKYDYYFTDGNLIGTEKCKVPTAGIEWRYMPPPALISNNNPVNQGNMFTTVMNWKSNKHIQINGITYGQKDMEFEKFIQLPAFTGNILEVAVSGSNVPKEQLVNNGWKIKQADDISVSVESYLEYIKGSKGEFSVAKNVFVDTWSGWFGDRPAYYMSFGKPVILQDTGWSEYLPPGEGLFSFSNMVEAIDAIYAINDDYDRHSKRAREIAFDHFEANKVIKNFLNTVGI
jgi:hypothetical protein